MATANPTIAERIDQKRRELAELERQRVEDEILNNEGVEEWFPCFQDAAREAYKNDDQPGWRQIGPTNRAFYMGIYNRLRSRFAQAEGPGEQCPNCGGTEHAEPLPGTVGRRCVKCCDAPQAASLDVEAMADRLAGKVWSYYGHGLTNWNEDEARKIFAATLRAER